MYHEPIISAGERTESRISSIITILNAENVNFNDRKGWKQLPPTSNGWIYALDYPPLRVLFVENFSCLYVA